MWSDEEMLNVSPILKHVVYPWLANSGYLRRRADGGAFCVLTYHGVLPNGYRVGDRQQDGSLVSAENLRAQLQLLKECYRVVSPEQVRDWLTHGKELPERAVLLTCDDGLISALTDMAPILQEEEVRCMFFVLGASIAAARRMLWYEELYLLLLAVPSGNFDFGQLGITIELSDRTQRRVVWWNLLKTLSRSDQDVRDHFIAAMRDRFELPDAWTTECAIDDAHYRRFGLMNKNELQQLAQMGMTIGSHTLNHPMLSQQTSELAWKEISASRSLLEEALAQPIWALAYPFGDPASVTTREMQMAEQAGFECAFMNVGGGFGASLPRFALPRVHVTADMNLSEFEAHLSGFHRDFRSRLSGDIA
jgi:peptidoglycan/xylan/chitin deacetylase (PgdA/CDA1 family)